MDGATLGLVGGLLGGAIGVAGGIFGTWCSVRAAQSDRERRYLVRWAVYFWVGISVFLALLFLLPEPYRWFLWLPYALALGWAVHRCNVGQMKIRETEARNGNGGTPEAEVSVAGEHS